MIPDPRTIIATDHYADTMMRCYGNHTIFLSGWYQRMPQIIGIRICRPLNNDKRKENTNNKHGAATPSGLKLARVNI